MLTKHDWESLNILWPAVIDAQHSEKPSIVKITAEIGRILQKEFDTIAIKVRVYSMYVV